MVCFAQEGSYVSTFTGVGFVTAPVNFPAKGETKIIENVCLGSSVLSVQKDKNGYFFLSDQMPLHMTTGPGTVTGKAGQVLVDPCRNKTLQKPGCAYGFMMGPVAKFEIPINPEATRQAAAREAARETPSKRVQKSARSVTLSLGGEEIEAFMAKWSGTAFMKVGPVQSLFKEVTDADGELKLVAIEKGQADLAKLLNYDDMVVYIALRSDKCTNLTNVNRLGLTMMADHKNVNDGKPIQMLTNSGSYGAPPGLFMPGLFGARRGFEEVEFLEWGVHRNAILQILKPMLQLSLQLESVVKAHSYEIEGKLQNIPDTDGKLHMMMISLRDLYKANRAHDFNVVLACIQTSKFGWDSAISIVLTPEACTILNLEMEEEEEEEEEREGESEEAGHEGEDEAGVEAVVGAGVEAVIGEEAGHEGEEEGEEESEEEGEEEGEENGIQNPRKKSRR